MNNRILNISGRDVGYRCKPYIIAEIGTNHEQDIEVAKSMIAEISKTKADSIKFQIYEPHEIVSSLVRASDYGLEKMFGDISAFDMFEDYLKTPKDWFPELIDYAKGFGLHCGATIHGFEGVKWASSLDFDWVKVASMDHNNTPLLKEMIKYLRVPILISFGMAVEEDIETSIKILKEHKYGFGIFHCLAAYPPEYDELRMENIPYLANKFDVPVGFSDHTVEYQTALSALYLGAYFFEKHVTWDKTRKGPDHTFAMEYDEFSSYVTSINTSYILLEEPKFIEPKGKELNNKKNYLKSITYKNNLDKNHIITEDDVYLVRPGTGIPPKYMLSVIGRKINKPVKKDTLVNYSDLED